MSMISKASGYAPGWMEDYGTVASALHSNRSACRAALRDFNGALADAERAVELRPQWAKAHSRAGAALHG